MKLLCTNDIGVAIPPPPRSEPCQEQDQKSPEPIPSACGGTSRLLRPTRALTFKRTLKENVYGAMLGMNIILPSHAFFGYRCAHVCGVVLLNQN